MCIEGCFPGINKPEGENDCSTLLIANERQVPRHRVQTSTRTCNSEWGFSSFPQFLPAKSKKVLQSRPRPLPVNPFPIHCPQSSYKSKTYSLCDALAIQLNPSIFLSLRCQRDFLYVCCPPH